MAKNKSKAQKHKDVFKVASSRSLKLKSKSKTKPVTTSLKKINIVNNEKVCRVNKAFEEVQKEIQNLSKHTPTPPKKPLQIPRPPPAEQLNVDATTQLFSQL